MSEHGHDSPIIKYIALNRDSEDDNIQAMSDDLAYLEKVLTRGPNVDINAIRDIFGDRVANLSPANFGIDREFDTISMVTFEVKLIQGAKSFVETTFDMSSQQKYHDKTMSPRTEAASSKVRQFNPVLGNIKSAAHVQVAFSFSVDMSTHLASAAEEEIDLLDHEIASRGVTQSSKYSGVIHRRSLLQTLLGEYLSPLVFLDFIPLRSCLQEDVVSMLSLPLIMPEIIPNTHDLTPSGPSIWTYLVYLPKKSGKICSISLMVNWIISKSTTKAH